MQVDRIETERVAKIETERIQEKLKEFSHTIHALHTAFDEAFLASNDMMFYQGRLYCNSIIGKLPPLSSLVEKLNDRGVSNDG